MIDPSLFTTPVPLDRIQHRAKRIKISGPHFNRTATMNALFVTAVEFIDVARDYPIVFVEAGQGSDGQRDVAPMAVLGLKTGENLMLQPDGTWAARYVPAMLRGYPLGLARAEEQQYVVVIDGAADALTDGDGHALFDTQGNPTPWLEEQRQFLEKLENEAERTRLFGRALIEADLLQPMRFDATLPDGQKLTVDGFLAVDEAKLAALPADKLQGMHANGVLGMIYAHRFSLGLMRGLVERRLARSQAA